MIAVSFVMRGMIVRGAPASEWAAIIGGAPVNHPTRRRRPCPRPRVRAGLRSAPRPAPSASPTPAGAAASPITTRKLATLQAAGLPAGLVRAVVSPTSASTRSISPRAPTADELGAAVEAALRAGFQVVVKPHLNPPAFQPGLRRASTATTTAGARSAPGAASSTSIR